MNTQIYINLPVADLPRSIAFFKALGFGRNPQFTDDTAACIVISEHIHVMVLTHAKFMEFTPKTICDTSKSIEMIHCLTCSNRAEVDTLVAKAVAAGGSTVEEATDYGFMYQHGFVDLDGHCWGLMHMSPTPPQN